MGFPGKNLFVPLLVLAGCSAGTPTSAQTVSKEQDLLDNLATSYYPFQQCTNAYLESKNFDRWSIFSGLASAGLLELASSEAARLVPPHNVNARKVLQSALTGEERARDVISALVTYGSSEAGNEGIKGETSRLRAMVAARLLIAKAVHMNCKPTDALNYWINQVDDEN
jgi:hypothetical protein